MPAKKTKTTIYAIILIAILLLIAIYHIKNTKPVRDNGLVGDQICGNFLNEADQDSCCSEAHKDDFVIACVGGWQYISGYDKCQYVCDDQGIACTEEAKVCDNGNIVSRNHENECEFDPCE